MEFVDAQRRPFCPFCPVGFFRSPSYMLKYYTHCGIVLHHVLVMSRLYLSSQCPPSAPFAPMESVDAQRRPTCLQEDKRLELPMHACMVEFPHPPRWKLSKTLRGALSVHLVEFPHPPKWKMTKTLRGALAAPSALLAFSPGTFRTLCSTMPTVG